MLEPVRQSYLSGRSLVWTRANALPDFVISITAFTSTRRGLQHLSRPVDKMPLMYNDASLQMEFCLDCIETRASTSGRTMFNRDRMIPRVKLTRFST